MTRKEFLALPGAALAASTRPKNVLFLMADEHRPHALGVDAHPLARTPNLDALARESVRFDHAYCTSPVCVPSRFSLMTGRYAHAGRVFGNRDAWPEEIPTIAARFAAAGYDTANIGKLHAVGAGKYGFQQLLEMKEWFDYLGPKAAIWKEEMDKTGQDGRKGPVHVGRVSRLPEEDHFESWVARESIAWLRARRGRPFFLVSSFIKPHDPFMPAERFAKLFPPEKMPLPETFGKLDLKTVPRGIRESVLRSPHTPELLDPANARIRVAMYYANLMQMDDRLGAVLGTLRELGLERDTVVVYCSDHGDMVGDKGLWLKFIMYENSVGVQLMFRVPGLTPAGKRCGSIASLTQVLPTLAEICGVNAGAGLDGASLVPLLREPERTVDSTAYSEIGIGGQRAMHMVRRGDFKYVRNRGDIEQLYDMRRDPDEMTNLALQPAYKEKCAEMRAAVERIYLPAAGY